VVRRECIDAFDCAIDPASSVIAPLRIRIRPTMEDDDIRRRVDELDAAISKDGAELLVYCEDIEAQAVELTGNRKGYLRAGIEMLKAAVVPMRSGDSITPIDLDYLVRNARSLHVKRLTREEDVQSALPPGRTKSWKENAIGMGCLVLLISFGICGFIGVGQGFTWIFGK
jgi:hypothetical protein